MQIPSTNKGATHKVVLHPVSGLDHDRVHVYTPVHKTMMQN